MLSEIKYWLLYVASIIIKRKTIVNRNYNF